MQLKELASTVQERARGSTLATTLQFLADNPFVFDSADGLQLWLGLSGEELRPVLELLRENGVVKTLGLEGDLIYTVDSPLVDDEAARKLLGELG